MIGWEDRVNKSMLGNHFNARESFAVMALPNEVRKIECEGFGGDVDDAIEKYFRHFKINSGDTEIPVELLQHPLTLRIFCQVTNPTRISEVKIDYFPASLSPLFEKYVSNACERISQMINLSYSYSVAEVEAAIYKLGIELWNSKQREVSESTYRAAVSDTARQWNSSIVNLLAQEGLVFRNPGREPGEYVITPIYDALGGYIVANALLAKYAGDMNFEWLKVPEVVASFGGKNGHELAVDIFESLVALAPRRMNRKQIWKEAPPFFRNAALVFTTNLEAEYLDQDTVEALLVLLSENPEERRHLFSKLQETRGAVNHPLNAEFLDTALRSMTVTERDLSWTEWVRANRSEKFNGLLAMELRWKEDFSTRTSSDRLRAEWVMWLLTSTDRQLRDVATRALYWYGRGDPAGLFVESQRALEINDPYVPERVLAASYGVVMACHVDIDDQAFVSTTLPRYARGLYELMFAEGAAFSTTHSLMREYATRIIEVASLHNPGLFSLEELERCQPPFTDGGLREWGESENSEEKGHGPNSPFRMDFENYTLGRLVPDRGNYNFNHQGYQKVRAQVLWRVEQLGWTSKLFETVDRAISNERHWHRMGSDAKKTDRYGKKYSWIAFFEMSGLLYDVGLLKNWRERTSSVDIDPSFPDPVPNACLIETDFLGDPGMDIKEWIANGPLPDVTPYLRLKEIGNMEGPWVALDGFVDQEDEVRGRRLFCFIRAFLIGNQYAASFLERLPHQDLGNQWLSQKPAVIYAFAGENPWCSTFPVNGQSEFSIVTKEEPVTVQRTQKEFYLDGQKLRMAELDMIRRRALGDLSGLTDEPQQISDEDLERIEVREVPVDVAEIKREVVTYNALIPVCEFGWEGYQSAANDAGSATTLAKEIASDLGLIGKPQSFDLFTKDGAKATYNVSDRSKSYANCQSMFFIKENLLKAYLKKKDLALIWAIWGDREYSSAQIDKLFHGPDPPEQARAVYSLVKHYD